MEVEAVVVEVVEAGRGAEGARALTLIMVLRRSALVVADGREEVVPPRTRALGTITRCGYGDDVGRVVGVGGAALAPRPAAAAAADAAVKAGVVVIVVIVVVVSDGLCGGGGQGSGALVV